MYSYRSQSSKPATGTRFFWISWLSILWLGLSATSQAQPKTETYWLSGQGKDQTVEWEFLCSEGRGCGEWTTIQVPSHWEIEGFGTYNYGHDDHPSRESGRYRHSFTVPEGWHGRTIDLVFEGVMTDAEVWINGISAGPKHQGSFYRFRYDITSLLDLDAENTLEVLVHKRSSDGSINRAEREADYWIFGGIYRPVYLTASPAESIDHIAIDARHDGEMIVEATTRGLQGEAQIRLQVENQEGQPAFSNSGFDFPLNPGEAPQRFSATWPAPQTWSAEFPHLYVLRTTLLRGSQVLHERTTSFGFRTFEVRTDGLYVNDQRVVLKGVNRHAFWPDSGRTLNRKIDESDVRLIKAMNMNAVRLSHYPPDKSFLEACDRQGLYVLNELAGWHDAYRTPTGQRLVEQMVRRDVNHPSILFWNNGNEGGWNLWMDSALHEADLQRRPVLRPDAEQSGIDTQHYLTWEEFEQKFDPDHWRNRWKSLFEDLPLIMPTELLHGLYDGGSGAGLEDYWSQIRTSPRGAGLFLWSFTDESVLRSDRDGELDSDGNHAPDGILGPYRERTAQFDAVREVLAPIGLSERRLQPSFDGTLTVENRFAHTHLDQCRFTWSWVVWPSPFTSEDSVVASGEFIGPQTPPGSSGQIKIPASPDPADALELTAWDPHGQEVLTWVLPWAERSVTLREWLGDSLSSQKAESDLDTAAKELLAVELERNDRHIVLKAGTFEVVFDAEHGGLEKLRRDSFEINLGKGPRRSDLLPIHPRSLDVSEDGLSKSLEIEGNSRLEKIRWQLFPSGWLKLSWTYQAQAGGPFHGIGFPLDGEKLDAMTWLGQGPGRVWKNRLQGGKLNVWHKPNTPTPPTSPAEPKFEGYYGDIVWARLEWESGQLVLVPEENELFLGILAPKFPEDAKFAQAEVPPSGLHFLHEIPAIGTKFHPVSELGPSGWPSTQTEPRTGSVWFFVQPSPIHTP